LQRGDDQSELPHLVICQVMRKDLSGCGVYVTCDYNIGQPARPEKKSPHHLSAELKITGLGTPALKSSIEYSALEREIISRQVLKNDGPSSRMLLSRTISFRMFGTQPPVILQINAKDDPMGPQYH